VAKPVFACAVSTHARAALGRSRSYTAGIAVFCSIFVLAGVLALYAAGNNRFFLSGLCLGAAVGLKLTCAAYALAMGLTLLLGWRLWQLSPWRYTTFVLGGILGAVITGGYWTWYLYDHKYPNRIDCINKNDLK
jgi:hypothetical protein